MPVLDLPTAVVRESFLAGERELARETDASTAWLDAAGRDFRAFAAGRAVVRERWGVPFSELWFCDGRGYIGAVNVRHALTDDLRRVGGNVGYHVVPSLRRRGHGREMLAQALVFCRDKVGLDEVLVTCAEGNLASRHVIEANGGSLTEIEAGECHYWFAGTRGPAEQARIGHPR